MAWAVVIINPASVPDKDTGATFAGVIAWMISRADAEAVFAQACADHPDFEVNLVVRDVSRAPVDKDPI
jgi:hypothetical protein